jgi:drug/metabolite transporter (DMT)-like permease
MYALIIVVLRVYARSFHPLSMCFFQNIMMALLLAPFLRPLSWELLPWLALMGVVHSTLAPVLYFRGMALCSANRAAVLGYTEPVWAILLGLAVLKEVPSGQSLAGGVLILLAGYLTLRSK